MANLYLRTKGPGLVFRLFLSILALSLTGLTACGDSPSPGPARDAVAPTAAPGVTTVQSTSTLAPATPTRAAQPVATAIPTTTSATTAASRVAVTGNDTGDPVLLRFSEFYAPGTSPINFQFSDKLKSANGKRVKITGYMAPPLKPDLDFFVLTRIKLAVCPFCSTAADWPEDIMLATMPDNKTVKVIEEPITVVGRLEIGEATDPKTGFFSLLRLRVEDLEVFKGS